ncbi:DUF4255 domain-containing protein [Streptomyces sp. NBC_01525]|uniref:DUF4255 domain-containing protein n=1 Tax=Streptomyces sp. NBC_01525 TaxID=2903893 RepID=UPI003867B172
MIHEVDEVIEGLLTGGVLAGTGIEIAFDAPTRTWASRRNSPTLNAYLYDIREDTARREGGTVPVRDEQGAVVRRRRPPRWFRLSYLVTAWTKRPQDEHRLLSAALASLLPHELLAPAQLPGALGALGLSVPLVVGATPGDARSRAELFSALGGELKPSVDLILTVPFPGFPEYDAGPPVTEGAVVSARELDGPLADAPRAHQERHLKDVARPASAADTAEAPGER